MCIRDSYNSATHSAVPDRYSFFDSNSILISLRGHCMIKLLIDNPLLLLFLVAAIGYPLGHVKIFGRSLGIAAVL